LAVGPVQREHQLGAQPLPKWVRGHQRGELGHRFDMPTQGEVSFDPSFHRGQAQLLKPGDLTEYGAIKT
jgi:hypothetical protein